MNHFKKISLAFLIFLLCGANACKQDLLDTVPKTSISDLTAFDTPDRILAQINGLYTATKAGTFLGGRYILYNEIRADEFIQTKSNTVTGLNTWGQSVNSSTTEVTDTWSNPYAVINQCNVFMTGLEENREKVDDTQYTQYLAEAKFLRGLCYYNLVKMFARPYAENEGASLGLPLRLQAETSNANNDLARSSVAEVYAQILEDLEDAENGLPLSYETALLNATRAHKNAAIALKTRVYLTMGKYEDVLREGAKIVSQHAPYQSEQGVQNRLEDHLSTVFGGSYTGPEALLFFPFSTNDPPGNTAALAYLYTNAPGNGEYYLNPSGTLSDPVFAAESTDERRLLVVENENQRWLNKFQLGAPYTDYIPLIRYAEVLLNVAEAAARTNDLAKGIDLLNAVRRRSDPGYSFAASQINTPETLLNTILNERKIELLGEGFRVPDLQRRLQPLPSKTGNGSTAPAVAVNASNYIWPISVNETSTNKLCEPNP